MMHTPRTVAGALVVAALLLPAGARAHGVHHQVDLRDGAVAVRVLYHGGRALAGAAYQVFPPGEPDRAREEGRTDRHGWLVFVPDVPGSWRVRVADATGHGEVVAVEVPAEAVARPAPVEGRAEDRAGSGGSAAAPRPVEGHAAPGETGGDDPGPLRVAGGAVVVALAFGALFVLQRRRRAAGR